MANQAQLKPKALFILHFPPPVYGATIANEYLLKSKIINNKFEAVYINLATNTKLVEVGRFTFKKISALFSIFYKVSKNLLQQKFDVCCISLTACGPAFYKDLIVVSILKLFNVNIIYFFHNKGIEEACKNTINHYLYKFIFHSTRSIILSKHLYRDIEKYVHKDNVFYCPYGIPITNTNNLSDKVIADSDNCRLLFLGNMMVEKGVLVLIDACKILKDKNYQFSCHFVGGWTDITEKEFNDCVQENKLSEVVFVHGPKYGVEKLSFFSNADIFVFPTFYHYETFGLVNLEAMQYGLPIISTPEGGIPEAIVHGKNGYLVRQKDAIALADKIELLINNPELRAQLGSAGQKRFHEFFTLETFEKNVAAILDETVRLKKLKTELFAKPVTVN